MNLALMLKSLGFDAEKVQGDVLAFGKGLQTTLTDLHARQVRTEAMVAALYRAQFGADYNVTTDEQGRPAGHAGSPDGAGKQVAN